MVVFAIAASVVTVTANAGTEYFEGELRFDEARIVRPRNSGGSALLRRSKVAATLKTADMMALQNVSSEVIVNDDPCDRRTCESELVLRASLGQAVLGLTIEGSDIGTRLLPINISATQSRILFDNDDRLFRASLETMLSGSVSNAIQYQSNMTQTCGQTKAWIVEVTKVDFKGTGFVNHLSTQMAKTNIGSIQVFFRAYPADQVSSDPMELIEGLANLSNVTANH